MQKVDVQCKAIRFFDGTSHGFMTAGSREMHWYSMRQDAIFTPENEACIVSLLCHNL